MTSPAVSLLAVLALATTSLAATMVNLDENNSCDSNVHTINLRESINVTTAGNIALGSTDCVSKFTAADPDGGCSNELVMCVEVKSINRMCYVNAEFSSMHKILKLDCTTVTPPMEWCANGNEELTLRLFQDPIKKHSNYGFTALVSTRCAKYDIEDSSHTHQPADPANDKIDFVDIQDAINSSRVIGIVVGVCLACMFLVALVVTYFYYKNKAYSGVPQD